MKHFGWLNWRLLLLFALVGPIAGLAALFVITLSQGGSGPMPLDVFGLVLAYSYLFGIVPATLTGLLLPAVFRLVPTPARNFLFVQLLVAFIVGLGISWLLFKAMTPFDAGAMALIGGFSGSTCALIAAALKVGPNNSFKPNPLRGSA